MSLRPKVGIAWPLKVRDEETGEVEPIGLVEALGEEAAIEHLVEAATPKLVEHGGDPDTLRVVVFDDLFLGPRAALRVTMLKR